MIDSLLREQDTEQITIDYWNKFLLNDDDYDINFVFQDDDDDSASASVSSLPLSIDDIERFLLSEQYDDQDLLNHHQQKAATLSSEEHAPPTLLHHHGNILHQVDDHPAAKKRKRQLRNRDVAMRTRERKKSYVKDLELKSKYYEAECKRLGMILQCCLAENQAIAAFHAQ